MRRIRICGFQGDGDFFKGKFVRTLYFARCSASASNAIAASVAVK